MEACQVSRYSGCSLFPSFPLWLYHHSTLPLAANIFITCCCHYHETFWVAPSANVMSEQNQLFDSSLLSPVTPSLAHFFPPLFSISVPPTPILAFSVFNSHSGSLRESILITGFRLTKGYNRLLHRMLLRYNSLNAVISLKI